MAWEKIEQRLKRPLNTKVPLPSGTIWLPDEYLSVDDWLTSVAETDEELNELNIPRMRFLNNRWSIERLVDLDGDDPFDRVSFLAMYIGERAYILMADREYRIIAALEPKSSNTLYGVVVGNWLHNCTPRHGHPITFKIWHPDLVPENVVEDASENWVSPDAERVNASSNSDMTSRADFSKRLMNWIGPWVVAPALGYWQPDDDIP